MSDSRKPKIDPSEIAGVECRNVTFIPPAGGSEDDYHLIKEIIHLKSGETRSNLRILKNYKRKYWITKDYHRKAHEQKKEWESIDKLNEYSTTQSKLISNAARSLGMFNFNGGLRKLCRSPYLYGCDIPSTSVIKQEIYRNKWPELNSPNTVATSDTETDMLHGTKKVIMQTISFKNKVFTAVTRSFLTGVQGTESDKIAKCKEAFTHYLGNMTKIVKENDVEVEKKVDIIKDRNLQWELVFVDTPGAVVWECLQKAHEWQPDILTFWNMDFDVSKMNEALEAEGYNLADAWSDKSVSPAYRFYDYKAGTPEKVTASGKRSAIPFHARWHTLKSPASFYVIDAMCAYKQIRTGKPEERSYGLDAIMNKHINMGKLSFEKADHLARAEWHIFMQKNYPIEYIIYNVFDCVGFDMLCEKTLDLSVSLPSGAAMSDYSKFNSQPRRVVDKLHYFALENNLVIATTSDQMETDYDQMTINLKNWIVMLPAHLVADNGIACIKEYPGLRSNLRLFVADLDVSASYPSGEVVFNISRETTKKELISIDGISESVRRAQGINLSGGASNSVEFCTSMFKMPTAVMLLEAYRRQDELDKVVEQYRDAISDAGAAAVALNDISIDNDELERFEV